MKNDSKTMKNDVNLCMKIAEECNVESVDDFLKIMNLSKYKRSKFFHIFKFQDHFDELPRAVNIRSKSYFELTLITQSTLEATDVTVDSVRFSSQSSSLTFVVPGQSTKIQVKAKNAEDLHGYLIVFTPEFLNNVFSAYNIIQRFPYFNIRFSPVHYLDQQKTEKLAILFDMVFEKFQRIQVGKEELLQAYFNVLLLELQDLLAFETIAGNRTSQIVYDFENLIKKTVAKHNVLDFYAEQLCISSTYLSQCVRQITGSSAKKVIDQYVIMEAQYLLVHSESDVGEISHQLGFEEVSNFIAYFKKNVGTTPLKFKRKLSRLT